MVMEAKKKQKPGRKRHPPEFRAGAVALVINEGRTVASVAEDLGLSVSVLHGWVKQARAEASGKSLSSTERAELARLQKEVKQLKMERDILKKAAAFFAKENA